MRYGKANNVERFLTYFIDFVIIGLCASGLCNIVYSIANYDTKVLKDILNRLYKEMETLLTAEGEVDLSTIESLMNSYFKHAFFELGINSIMSLIVISLYLVILPMFWKYQTVGRFIMKTKVVALDGSEASKKVIILRELVGSLLCYRLIGGVLIFISAILVLAKQRSLVDYIGGSDLISVKYGPVKAEDEVAEKKPNDDDEYIEARFKEVDSEACVDESDDYKII